VAVFARTAAFDHAVPLSVRGESARGFDPSNRGFPPSKHGFACNGGTTTNGPERPGTRDERAMEVGLSATNGNLTPGALAPAAIVMSSAGAIYSPTGRRQVEGLAERQSTTLAKT
jgi:hypothetical protein